MNIATEARRLDEGSAVSSKVLPQRQLIAERCWLDLGLCVRCGYLDKKLQATPFYFHSGNYTGGNREIEKLVDKADVVFCPVDFNSHYACRCVKKVCKLTGKPCCFLRSSSLSTFRRELAGFAMKPNGD